MSYCGSVDTEVEVDGHWYRTNRDGEGLWQMDRRGNWSQIRGTGQFGPHRDQDELIFAIKGVITRRGQRSGSGEDDSVPVESRGHYMALFATRTEAIEFESNVLQGTADDDLPEEARRVKAGELDEPSAEYWGWLSSQVDG